MTETESKELSLIEKARLPVIEFKDKYNKKLQDTQKTYSDVVYDLSTKDKRKKAREDRATINKTIKELDEAHSNIKKPFAEAVKLIDSERKTIKDEFIKIESAIGDQLKAHDQKIKTKLDNITSLYESLHRESEDFSPDLVQNNIDELEKIVIDDSFFDKQKDAELLKTRTMDLLVELKQRAIDAAELKRLKEVEAKAVQDEAIRIAQKEAEEKAQLVAQAKIDEANKRAQEAEENKKMAAENAAKAERERIEKQQAEEQEALEAKKANQEHRAKIHKEIKECFMDEFSMSNETAVVLVKKIIDGKIKHLSINY